METKRNPLFLINEISDSESKGFTYQDSKSSCPIIAVKQKGNIFLYKNSCPHTGATLDFDPGQFLDSEKRSIMCSSHGALFRIKDGYCFSGPCKGKFLKKVKYKIKNSSVIVKF